MNRNEQAMANSYPTAIDVHIDHPVDHPLIATCLGAHGEHITEPYPNVYFCELPADTHKVVLAQPDAIMTHRHTVITYRTRAARDADWLSVLDATVSS